MTRAGVEPTAAMDVLICHDGELADIGEMLRALGHDFSERIGPPPLAELARYAINRSQ